MKFSNLFLFYDSFTVHQICFVPLTICLLSLPRVHIVFLYILWLQIWHDEVVQWAENKAIYVFSKEGPCLWHIRCFNSVLGPTAYCLFSHFWDLKLSLIFVRWYLMYQSTTRCLGSLFFVVQEQILYASFSFLFDLF